MPRLAVSRNPARRHAAAVDERVRQVLEVLGARFDALELNALVQQVVVAEDLARRWRPGTETLGRERRPLIPALRREAGSAARTRCVERIVVRAAQPAVVEALNVGEDFARQTPAALLLGEEWRAQRGCQLFVGIRTRAGCAIMCGVPRAA